MQMQLLVWLENDAIALGTLADPADRFFFGGGKAQVLAEGV